MGSAGRVEAELCNFYEATAKALSLGIASIMALGTSWRRSLVLTASSESMANSLLKTTTASAQDQEGRREGRE